MGRFQDMGLLLAAGFFSLFYREADAAFVVAFLLCLSLCCTGYFMESRRVHLVLAYVFLLGCLISPAFLFFCPVVFYLLLYDGYWLAGIPAVGVYVLYVFLAGALPAGILPTDVFPAGSFPTGAFSTDSFLTGSSPAGVGALRFLAWGAFLFVAAYCLCRRTLRIETLELDLMRLRDDSMERNLLLAEKNRMLAEKQNSEIYAATLKERNRIAREIHDNVGHLLSRSILLTGAAKTVNASPGLSPMLENLDETLNQAMTGIRTSVHDLHDDSVNLREAVNGLIRDFTFCPVTLEYDVGQELPREVKYCMISILKEALSNIIRHSHASYVHVILREHPAIYQMCVENDGVGETYEPEVSRNARTTISKTYASNVAEFESSGIGLSNMRDRVDALKGTMQISTENGFRIFIIIPKKIGDSHP